MKKSSLLKLMNLYPPFLGAGIRVRNISDNLTSLDVEMKLTFWNRNIVKTQFGGSLYSMTDPFYMLMLMENLGRNYIVWDKSASIEFKRPGRGKVHAKFRLTLDEINSIRKGADENYKIEPEFVVDVLDENDEVVAKVFKKLYVRRKK